MRGRAVVCAPDCIVWAVLIVVHVSVMCGAYVSDLNSNPALFEATHLVTAAQLPAWLFDTVSTIQPADDAPVLEGTEDAYALAADVYEPVNVVLHVNVRDVPLPLTAVYAKLSTTSRLLSSRVPVGENTPGSAAKSIVSDVIAPE